MLRTILFCSFMFAVCATNTAARTTGFTYQRRPFDGPPPASGTYEMRFKLYSAEPAGTERQQPAPITLDFTASGRNPVSVRNGSTNRSKP